MEIFFLLILWLHILASVVWIGGMAFNILILRPSITVIDAPQRIKLAETVLRRFISFVWASIGVLILTGAILALPKMTSFKTLLSSSYGGLLILKLLIVMVMIINVFIIQYILFPKFKSLIPSPGGNRVMGQIVTVVKINLIFGTFVFLTAELLSLA